MELDFAAHVPPDQNLVRGIMEQVPVASGMPRSPAARAISKFARERATADPSNALPGGLGIFWRRILREQEGAGVHVSGDPDDATQGGNSV